MGVQGDGEAEGQGKEQGRESERERELFPHTSRLSLIVECVLL